MALISCPECLNKISEWALWCPKCGLGREFFAPHVMRISEDRLSKVEKEALIARGYRIDSTGCTPIKKTLFTPSGDRVEATYYDKDLMIVNGEKVLGSLIGKELKEQDPTLLPSKFEDIQIESRLLPAHGVGHIVRAYAKKKSIDVIVCFPQSKMLRTKTMQTVWDISAFGEENLFSPQIGADELKEMLTEHARNNYSNIDLQSFIKTKAQERIRVISHRLGRKEYHGHCVKCGSGINSADNRLCAYCGKRYACSHCGYCPTCHSDSRNDPYDREQRLRLRLTDAEWMNYFDPSDSDDYCYDYPDNGDWDDMPIDYCERDFDDDGPEEEPYEYYHGDDEPDFGDGI